MLTQVILFVMVYTAIGTLIAGYMIPRREWEDSEEVTNFIVTMVGMWWMQLCITVALYLAEYFYEED